jgi:hypothetical protein
MQIESKDPTDYLGIQKVARSLDANDTLLAPRRRRRSRRVEAPLGAAFPFPTTDSKARSVRRT